MDQGELELIRQAAGGRSEAFRRLVERNQAAVFHLSLRMLGDREEAEDVVQETFLRLYRHLPDYKAGHKLSNWLYTIALNLCRNKLRRRKVLRFFSLEAWTGAEPAEPEAAQTRETFDRMVATLPESLREAFLLRYLHELPDEEIAGVLGLSVGNVRVRIHRAKARLWETFGKG